jgi:hypothetical protein
MIKYPVPRNLRQMLQLFRFYDAAAGLASVFDHIDWIPASPSQVYSSVLGRLPETREFAVPNVGYSAKKLFEATLNSAEFQENLIKNVLAAFPEKQRVLFVHIPRTAGTDFEEHLAEKMPSLYQVLQDSTAISKAKLFVSLRNFAENVDLAERILICGHIPLSDYLAKRLRRFDDQLITIVRDPVDLLISNTNYILTVIRDMRDPERPDRQIWLDHLKIGEVPENISETESRTLALRILRDEALIPGDQLCFFLGNGTEESALDLLAISNMEITDVTRYSKWLRSRWDVATNAKRNASRPVLLKQHLSSEDYDFLLARTRRDQGLYWRIVKRLEASETLSINGVDLASPSPGYN